MLILNKDYHKLAINNGSKKRGVYDASPFFNSLDKGKVRVFCHKAFLKRSDVLP